MFGAKAELERLARRVAGLEAKLEVVLQLTAIQMADPALYEQVIRTVTRWQEEPAGPQGNGREPSRNGTGGPALPRDSMRGRGTSPREDGGSDGSGRPDGDAGDAPAGWAAASQLANMMRYAGREQPPEDVAGE